MKTILKRIIDINNLYTKNPINSMAGMIKIQEECGELSAEILRYYDKKGANGVSKKSLKYKILEEACDVIITGVNVIADFDYTPADIIKMVNKKCSKWEKNQKKFKEFKNVKKKS